MFLKKRDEGVTTASGSMRGVPQYYEPACLRACTRKEHPSHAHPAGLNIYRTEEGVGSSWAWPGLGASYCRETEIKEDY